MDQRDDHHHRGDRQQDHPALVQEGRVVVGAPDQDRDRHQADHSHAVEDLPGARGHPAGQLAAGPDHRQGRPEEEAECARIGAVVDPRRVEPRLIQKGHREGRGGRERQRHRGEPGANRDRGSALGEEAQAQEQQPGPQEVELLLDRQRPQVAQRGRRAEAGEVGDVLVDHPPVAEVPGRRPDRSPQVRKRRGLGQGHPRHHHHQHHEQRGQQAPGPPQPEVGEPQASPGGPLAQQKVGDEVAAQGEEHPHAEEPPGSPAQAQVIGDHGQHGDGAQPVEPGHIALAAADGSRHIAVPRDRTRWSLRRTWGLVGYPLRTRMPQATGIGSRGMIQDGMRRVGLGRRRLMLSLLLAGALGATPRSPTPAPTLPPWSTRLPPTGRTWS